MNSGEEHSPAAPTRIPARNLSIVSPALIRTSCPRVIQLVCISLFYGLTEFRSLSTPNRIYTVSCYMFLLVSVLSQQAVELVHASLLLQVSRLCQSWVFVTSIHYHHYHHYSYRYHNHCVIIELDMYM